MSANQVIVNWKALHGSKQSVAIPKRLLQELAPPTIFELLWLLALFFWSMFCCPITRLAFEVIGEVLDELIPEATDIALCTLI